MHKQQPAYRQRRRRKKKNKQVITALIIMLFLAIFALIASLYSGYRGRKDTMAAISPPYTIVLDAGHGGGDIGAQGVIQEIEMTETTTRFLYNYLARDANFIPIVTRQEGEGASLRERIDVANNNKTNLFISIHGNADQTGEAEGFECFPTPPGREFHEESTRFATLLASEMQGQGALLRGENGVRFMYFQNNEEDETTRIIQEASNGEVHSETSFAVVEKTNCPAVLVEQCFITNQNDVDRFATEEGCRRAALAYYHAICVYFDLSPVE